MKIKLNKQKGFTLIEVLIALAIFMVFITGVSSAYIDIARSQREANLVREIYSDMRYVFGMIEEEARSKTIDYACYQKGEVQREYNGVDLLIDLGNLCSAVNPNITNPEDYLALVDAEGLARIIFKIEGDEEAGGRIFTFYREHYTGAAWEPDAGFNPTEFTRVDLKNIKINAFKFEISPLADPFDPRNVACGPVQFQPQVGVYASIEGARSDTEGFKMNLQTSISSRVYNRKTTL